MAAIALVLIGLAGWGLTRVPTGFIPTEDQGYLMIAVQMPDGASLERAQNVMDRISKIGLETPGAAHAIAIGTGGPSPLDGDVSLANAGIVYLMLESWGERDKSKGEDLAAVTAHLESALSKVQEAHTRVLVPAPIQGLGASTGFQMQVELTDGGYDFERLQRVTDEIVREANASPEVVDAFTAFRASVPQVNVRVDKTQAATRSVNVGDVYNTVQIYLGSSFVNLFTRYGHNYMVYLQADPLRRLNARDVKNLYVRNSAGAMVPVGALAEIQEALGPTVVSLYNLFPAATINGMPAPGYSTGQALDAMERIAGRVLPRGMSFEWTAMSYQEKLVGNSAYFIFGLSILLVYFALAGQYESWITPAAVILAVPLALLGTAAALIALGIANNIYVQIGLVLLIALSAKNAILIVEMAREGREKGLGIPEATVEASRVRFRPILMTSFTFILGVLPLVLASGAGSAARRSLGIAVAAGMLASTCLAVLFVPSLFVVLQRWIERKGAPHPVSRPPGERALEPPPAT
jgi:HAE1 family hydrophobic/amphiphilic exporter-1